MITSTHGDPKLLVERAIPSVDAQTYRPIEHVIVVDGPNELPAKNTRHRRIVHLGRNWHEFTPMRSWGTMARLVASGLARGEYIAYLDDDDEFVPEHVEKLVDLLESTGSDWVYSQMRLIFKGVPTDRVIGDGNPRWGAISTQLLLHRVEMFNNGNWDPEAAFARGTLPPERRHMATYASDWDLVGRWLETPAKWAFLPEITVLYHKDTYRIQNPVKEAPAG
ncbi:MAG: hypothetical protein QOE92_772 [Chloroflexota bacterium]|nr:hypothetical protein [Chloroflexota bacterium]